MVTVARDVPRQELRREPDALAAQDKEWSKLWGQKVWDKDSVKGWKQVASDAREEGRYLHIGKLFGLCVEKGSELPLGHPSRKYKYRVVLQCNLVFDQKLCGGNIC